MPSDDPIATFERETELSSAAPTLIEGLPGHGMVASIAVDQITDQLGLAEHGTIRSEEFPPVAAFEHGRVREAVRVYAGADPDVMTLQSDVPIPPNSVRPLSRCVIEDLADEFDRAIFLAGAPADSEGQIGDVLGVATSDAVEADLEAAGIDVAEGPGAIGGVTGALVSDCFHADIPAAVLVVRANPYMPDPAAARSVIENALEPLVEFDIDTTELEEQAEQIQKQKEQIAKQLQQLQGAQQQSQQPSGPSMYQ
ncbi:MAG: proteasome assembly chaperone family protein [Halobacteriaceae archaeon]